MSRMDYRIDVREIGPMELDTIGAAKLDWLHPPRSEPIDWVEARSGWIGSSEVSAVFGVSPYLSQYQLWQRKTNRVPPWPGNRATRRGHALEPYVLGETSYDHHGIEVWHVDVPAKNPDFPHLRATIDGWVPAWEKHVECKAPGSSGRARWRKMAETRGMVRLTPFSPQLHAWLQCQAQMAVLGLPECLLVVAIKTVQPIYIELEAKPGFAQKLNTIVEGWWNRHIIKDTPPAKSRRDRDAEADIGELIRKDATS